MKEVNFLRIILVDFEWLVADFGSWMLDETSNLRNDNFGGLWVKEVTLLRIILVIAMIMIFNMKLMTTTIIAS